MTRTRLYVLASIVVLGAAGLLIDPHGLRHTRALQKDAAGLQATNHDLEVENDRLRRELSALADDPAALERAAREELGLVMQGEVVFRLEDGDDARAP